MQVTEKISYKISKEIAVKCKTLDIDEQISLLNISIFEDSTINHTDRLKYQFELLNFAKKKNSLFNVAYILNLIAQTNTQTGNLAESLDNLMSAEKIWRKILKNKSTSSIQMSLNGLILCLSDIGNIYMKMGLFDDAMGYFERSLKKVSDDDDFFVPYFKIHFHLSEIYNTLNFTAKSKEMINKCIKRASEYKFADKSRSYIYLIPSYMQLASINSDEKNYHKSIEIFNKTLQMCEKFNDVIYKQQILLSIGEVYTKLSEFNKASKFIKQAEKMDNKIGSDSRLLDIKTSLSILLISKGEFHRAMDILEDAKQIAENNNLELQLIEIYKNLSLVYENLEKTEQSFLYNKMHAKLMSDYYVNKNKLLVNENRKTIQDLSNAIKEKYEIETSKDLEMNRKFNIRSQTTKTLYRIRENNILESLKNDINNVREIIDKKDKKHIDKILTKISFHLQDHSSWKEFEAMFMQIHDDFVQNLNNISSELTSKQIRFCMFIKMGMDKYDICSLLNVTTRAIEQQRYRIKKILKTDQNLDSFIQEL